MIEHLSLSRYRDREEKWEEGGLGDDDVQLSVGSRTCDGRVASSEFRGALEWNAL
jgi:hypothetical protein